MKELIIAESMIRMGEILLGVFIVGTFLMLIMAITFWFLYLGMKTL